MGKRLTNVKILHEISLREGTLDPGESILRTSLSHPLVDGVKIRMARENMG